MSERPYPEAIRGAWFLLSPDQSLEQAQREKNHDILVFHLDNSYQLLTLKGGVLKNTSNGNYTFDGNFLITRARATETYRVLMHDHQHWSVETRKGTRHMHRTLHTNRPALSEAQQKDLRILPIKARAKALVDASSSPLMLHMGDQEIAVISVDRWETNKTCWFGIAPLIESLEPRTWQRIIEESVFALTLEDTEGIDAIEILMLDEPGVDTTRITLQQTTG